jgi:hypothetical protein
MNKKANLSNIKGDQSQSTASTPLGSQSEEGVTRCNPMNISMTSMPMIDALQLLASISDD